MVNTDAISSFFQLQLISSPTLDPSPSLRPGQTKHSPELDSILHHYSSLFTPPSGLPPPRSTNHKITLADGSNPVNVHPYRYPHFQKLEIEKLVKEMLDSGIIQRSTSDFSSPVLLVKKKDGTWRFCVDYRALNSLTCKDRFPIPTIDELIDELHGTHWFSKLDLSSGFHQIRMHPTNAHKTAF